MKNKNKDFEKRMLAICIDLKNNLASIQTQDYLSPIDRFKVYECAITSGSYQFLVWLDITVCQYLSHYLKESPLLSTYFDLLNALIVYARGGWEDTSPPFDYHGHEAILSIVTNSLDFSSPHVHNAHSAALAIVNTVAGVSFGYSDIYQNNNFGEITANDCLDPLARDTSLLPLYLLQNNEEELFCENRRLTLDYWLWWLEEAIPQALEKCNEFSG